jgi:hypothetical protein
MNKTNVDTMAVSVRYQFSLNFSVSAREAFDWCTAFDEDDNALMGDSEVKREIIYVTNDTLLLKDTFPTPTGTVEKQKLVALYPEQHRWTSTHLSGPNRHSQFLYSISPRGKDASVLEFTALHIEYDEKADSDALAERLCREDAAAWVRLAKAMATELRK